MWISDITETLSINTEHKGEQLTMQCLPDVCNCLHSPTKSEKGGMQEAYFTLHGKNSFSVKCKIIL